MVREIGVTMILLDFESRSECDLEALGGRGYWAHPTTQAICCWLHDTDANEWLLWLPGDPCPFGPDDVLAAHNMTGFDRFAVAAVGWRALDEGPPYVDTSELARVAGLPGALDALAKRWLGREKNHAGNAVTRRLSGIKTPMREVEKGLKFGDSGEERWGLTAAERKVLLSDGVTEISRTLWEVPEHAQVLVRAYEREWKASGAMPAIDRELLDYVIAYCRDDVEVLVHGWPLLAEWLDTDLPGVSAVDRLINDRGVLFDVPLARALLAADAQNQAAAIQAVADSLWATPEEIRDAAKSPKQFCEITDAPNAQAATVASMDHPLARLREALASIASGKLTAALTRLSPDGRLRDNLRYFGAHTGRWSGKGMQLQNMPRPDKRFEEWHDAEICALADRVLGGYVPDQAEIDLLIRACIVARPGHSLIWWDYSAVEGRGLAWAADDQPALDVYRQGLDPYVVSAGYVYSGETYEQLKAQKSKRQIGKVCELALGYQGGEGAFDNMARSLGIDVSHIDRKAVIAKWRAGRQPTVRFWNDLQRAFIAARMSDRPTRVGAFEFCPGPKDSIAMVLPSGRPVVYWGVQVSRGTFGASLSYEGANYRERLYGGKIAENAVQAFCRDILADALVRVESAGIPLILSVHDEGVGEVPTNRIEWARETVHSITTVLPSWLEGFPPKAQIESGTRYRK